MHSRWSVLLGILAPAVLVAIRAYAQQSTCSTPNGGVDTCCEVCEQSGGSYFFGSCTAPDDRPVYGCMVATRLPRQKIVVLPSATQAVPAASVMVVLPAASVASAKVLPRPMASAVLATPMVASATPPVTPVVDHLAEANVLMAQVLQLAADPGGKRQGIVMMDEMVDHAIAELQLLEDTTAHTLPPAALPLRDLASQVSNCTMVHDWPIVSHDEKSGMTKVICEPTRLPQDE